MEELTECRLFLEDLLSSSVNEWEIKTCSFYLQEFEILGEVVNLVLQYLFLRRCPVLLKAPITRAVVEAIENECRKSPIACGYDISRKDYEPSKLKNQVIASIKNCCQKFLDNIEINKILSSKNDKYLPPLYFLGASRNGRRTMEDKHICVDDFSETYNIPGSGKASFYAVFDGHDGSHAAYYSVSQLPLLIATDPSYPKNPPEAIRNGFAATDNAFLKKCRDQQIKGGTTVVCALYRPEESRIYVGWVGDSKAMLVKNGQVMQIVKPHKPECLQEQNRIKDNGGTVMMWAGSWRVNGVLNVSRAIGDNIYKEYVISKPDIVCVDLDHSEDFLILACDGLWDYVTEDEVATTVYTQIKTDPNKLEKISQHLIDLSKRRGSTDNITVIVVFLKNPRLIFKTLWPLENMEAVFDNSNNCEMKNSSQALIPNPNINIDFKTEDTSKENFQTGGAFNDGLNNLVQLNDANNPFGEFGDDLIQKDTFNINIDINNVPNKNEKRPFENEGPETCVDTTDDVIMLSEDADNTDLFEQSTLSHSKETLPSSDNFNPFDLKNSNLNLESDDLKIGDDLKSPSSNASPFPLDDHVNSVSIDETLLNKNLEHVSNELNSNGYDFKYETNLKESFGFEQDNSKIAMQPKQENIFEEEKVNKDYIHNPDDFNEKLIDTNLESYGMLQCNPLEPSEKKPIHSDYDQNIDQNIENILKESIIIETSPNEIDETLAIDEKIENLCENKSIEELANDKNIVDDIIDSHVQEEFAKEKEFGYNFDEQESSPQQLVHEKEISEDFIEEEPLDQFGLPQEINTKPTGEFVEEKDLTENIDEKFINREFEEESEFGDDFCDKYQGEELLEEKEIAEDISDKQVSEELVKENEFSEDFNEKYVCEDMLEKAYVQELAEEKDILKDNEFIDEFEKENLIMEHHKKDNEFLDEFDKQDFVSQQKECVDDFEKEQIIKQISEKSNELIESFNLNEEHVSQEIEKQKEISEDDIEKQISGNELIMEKEIAVEKKFDEDISEKGDEVKEPEFENDNVHQELSSATPSTDNSNFVDVIKPVHDSNLQEVLDNKPENHVQESGDESEDEWNYMKLKEGEGEKETIKSEVLPDEDTKSNIQTETIEFEKILPTKSQEPKEIDIQFEQEETTQISNKSSVCLEKEHSDSLDKEVEDMTSQLNPEAKEFVPTSPPAVFNVSNGTILAATRGLGADDVVVAQSPRKGAISMEDIQVPSENEFDNEISSRPSELEDTTGHNEHPEELNIKEAMHGAEKEELASPDELYDGVELENADMKKSIYIENLSNKEEYIMNTVQNILNENDNIETEVETILDKNMNINNNQCDNINDLQQVGKTEEEFNKLSLSEVTSPLSDSLSHEIGNDIHIAKIPNQEILSEPKPIEKIPEEIQVENGFGDKFLGNNVPVEIVPVIATAAAVTAVGVTEKLKTLASPKPTKDLAPKISKPKVAEAKKTDTKTKTMSSATGLKKTPSPSSATTATAKPKPNAISKPKTAPPSLASRPRTVPVASKAGSLAEKKTTSTLSIAKPKIEPKTTSSTLLTKKTVPSKPKPDEQKFGAKPTTTSRTGVTTKPLLNSKTTTSTLSTTTKTRPTGTTNVTTTKTLNQRVALSPNVKSTSLQSPTKTATSPRSTLTSTLRKTEALKSPTNPTTRVTATKTSTLTSRTTNTTKSTTTATTKVTGTTAGLVRKTTTTTTTATKSLQKKSPIKKPLSSSGKTVDKVNIPDIITNAGCINNEIKLNGTALQEKKD